jgi:hypothetical protein
MLQHCYLDLFAAAFAFPSYWRGFLMNIYETVKAILWKV